MQNVLAARVVLQRVLMTAPRFIRPGRTWLVTRRTTRRTFLLRPDADQTSQNIYWYTTAVFANKFGIRLHAVQVLSTHIHEVLTDVRGNLPAFLRERNRALANALKRHRNWPEEVFQRAPTSCVEIYGVEALCREIAYTLANCVEAGLTRTPEAWPGVRTLIADIGRRVVRVHRPTMYFRTRNEAWPASAELRIDMPSSLEAAYGRNAWRKLARVLRSTLARAATLARRAGDFLLGSVGALMWIPFNRSAIHEEVRGSRNPNFATAGDPGLTRIAVEERRHFHCAYRASLQIMKKFHTRVPFPFGTWRWVQELQFEREPDPPWLDAASA